MMLVRLLALAFALLLSVAAANAQCSGQYPAGAICGNPTATQALPTATQNPILGAPGLFTGSLGFSGGSSGTVTVSSQNVAGTWTLQLPNSAGTSGQVLSTDGTGVTSWSSAGAGSVTSVGLSAPAEFTVSGSPVTLTGTLAFTKATESANTVWAGPTSGGAAQPAFRALVIGDLPSIGSNTVIGNATSGSAVPTALSVTSCSTASSALIWTTNTGFGCNTVVSSVATGTGLTGGTITSTGTISLASIAADNLLGNATGGSAVPAAVPLPSCSTVTSALTYNISTHTIGCNNINSTGTVTPGTAGQIAWYNASTNIVVGNSNANISNGTLTLGTASTTLGSLILEGSSSGAATITPQAAAGTPTLTIGTSSGTIVTTGAAPLAVSATTGQVSITGAAGKVLAGSGATFTATPTIGLSGTTGILGIAGSSSGTVSLTVAAAAGTWTMQLPTTGGSAGQFLETDGTGVATWASPSGSGTVNSGTGGQLAYYGANGTAVSGNGNATISAGTLTLGTANTTLGALIVEGSSSGAVMIQPAAAAGTYNFNLPTGAGTSGQALLSGGGGASAMTFGTLGAAAGGTGLTSGTSGGVLCFTGSTTIASSAALTSAFIVTGGGAGVCPGSEQFATLAQGGLGASQAGATANQIPVFPGSSGAAVPTSISTWLGNAGAATDASDMYFGSGRPWVDVMSNVGGCAIPAFDGSTDDTTAIQCHINYAETHFNVGATVYFPPQTNPGCIKTAGGLIMHNQGIYLIGASKGSAILSACGTDTTVVTSNNVYQSIQRMTILGKGVNNDTGSFGATQPALVIGALAVDGWYVDLVVTGGAPPLQWNSGEVWMYGIKVGDSYAHGNLWTTSGVSVASATVVSGGSGGSNGACTLTVTSGSGLAATLSGTISGGVLQAGLTVVQGGSYTLAGEPTNPATVSGCSLSGATVNLTLTTGVAGGFLQRAKLDDGWPVALPAVGTAFPAWASSHAYNVGDTVNLTFSGKNYYIQCFKANAAVGASCGTSGTSSPTPKNYGLLFADNAGGGTLNGTTSGWLLASCVSCASYDADSGTTEIFIEQGDFSGPHDFGLVMRNTLGGAAPSTVKCDQCTFSQAVTAGVELLAGQLFETHNSEMSGGLLVTNGAAVVAGGSFSGLGTFIGGSASGAAYGFIFGVGTNYVVSGVSTFSVTNCFSVSVSHITIHDSPCSSSSGGLIANSGNPDEMDIHDNDLTGAPSPVVYSSTGTHNFIKNNRGYNPVGSSGGVYSTGSGATYRAGPTDEVHYLTGGTVTAIKNDAGSTIANFTPFTVFVPANGTFSVTYSAAPGDNVTKN